MSNVPTILNEIIAYKRVEVAELKSSTPKAILEEMAQNAPRPRGFIDAIEKRSHGEFSLIAEIKKASPSKGIIRMNFNPQELASAYSEGGATCLSVLTDAPSFQGKNEYLIAASQATNLPIIRKDFMIDPFQIIESRAIGADAILLIMACLDDYLAKEMFDQANELGMDALVEVHNEEEAVRAIEIGAKMIGVNNRDLHSFNVDLSITERLADLIPNTITLVAESGISNHQDLQRLYDCGARGFLVGECLMRQDDVTLATKKLLKG